MRRFQQDLTRNHCDFVGGCGIAATLPGTDRRKIDQVEVRLISTGGAAIKLTALSSWQVAGFRSGIAALVLWLLIPGARRGWTWRTALIGVAYAATLILFVLANKLTTSANAIFLQYTAPAYVAARPAFDFATIVYNCPSTSAMSMAVALAKTRNFGYIYVTDDKGVNPYDRIPTYWTEEKSAVHP